MSEPWNALLSRAQRGLDETPIAAGKRTNGVAIDEDALMRAIDEPRGLAPVWTLLPSLEPASRFDSYESALAVAEHHLKQHPHAVIEIFQRVAQVANALAITTVKL